MGRTDASAAIPERDDHLATEPEEIGDLPRQPPGLDPYLGGDWPGAPFTYPACHPFLCSLLLEQAWQSHRTVAEELCLQAQCWDELVNDLVGRGRKTRIEDEVIDGNADLIRCRKKVPRGLS